MIKALSAPILFFLFRLVISGGVDAQEASVFLEPVFSNKAKDLSITISTDPPLSGCSVTLHGAAKRAPLIKKIENNFIVAINSEFNDQAVYSAARLKPLRLSSERTRRANAFLRALLSCNEGVYLSSVEKLRLKRRGNKGPKSVGSWLKFLKKKIAANGVTLVDAFPNLSFTNPVDIQRTPERSGKLFVVEQGGTIKSFDNTSAVKSSNVFLDMKDRVVSGGERGLLGLAFHPDFESNGYIYVNYTASPDGTTHISRFTVSGGAAGQADPNSELSLLTVAQPFSNHNGGALAFGPDGFLYIALGDGGSGGDPLGHAQNKASLLGKMLRINVDSTSGGLNYSIPSSNPFKGNSEGWREEIYAFGLRNPWRFSFDTANGELWAGDVGQGAKEEIDIISNGGNFGWNIMEGSDCFENGCSTAGLILPIFDYPRSQGQSVTGGYVYRGKNIPALGGSYIYGDFVSGKIWVLRRTESAVSNNELIDTDYGISTFGVDDDQELFVADYMSGKLYKFNPA